MSKTKTKDLTNKVMKEIHDKNIKMKPKIYFIFGSAALGMGLSLAFVIAVFFINLSLHRLSLSGPFGFLSFGRLGLRPFLFNFPWLCLILSIAGILGGLSLLRCCDISYKKGFLGLIIGLMAFALTLGFILSRTPVNQRLKRLKYLRPFYQSQFSSKNWLVGEITKVDDQSLVVKTPQGETITVVFDDQTQTPTGREFVIGDQIRAVGEKQNSLFKAQGIVKGKMPPPFLRPPIKGRHHLRP